MTCFRSTDLGVYLLGSLDPVERGAFERHLGACPPCRRELLRLAPLPGLLGQVTLLDLEQPFADPEPSPELAPLPELPPQPPPPVPRSARISARTTLPLASPLPPVDGWLVGARAKRRTAGPAPGGPGRRSAARWPLLVCATALFAVLLVGALLLTPGLLTRDDQAGPVPVASSTAVTWAGTDAGTGVAARAELVGRDWGTELLLTLDGAPDGARCRLVVHGTSGRTETAGWWGSGPTRRERVPGATSFALADVERVDVVADMRVLVSVRP
ncbi:MULTISPECIES: anti-sigma factor [Actinosynnema]|uniref:anti-sigma factor family protein n=1 Tax=Actinosynnema TaxID=40566 RepID=UPI0020A602E2|nr:zf-HC2 domain-containing protein [Actinosynnema pretiosum]MCP2093936.1 putative zinc-finger [Actinosynnema pretiosum]